MTEFNKVTSGQEFQMPAKLYNWMVDSAIGNQTRNQQVTGLPRSFEFTKPSKNFIKIFNNSGVDIAAFSPVGLNSLEFTPGSISGNDNEEDFIQGNVVFEAVKPNETLHKIRFAITQEGIKDQEMGFAVTDGTTVARIALSVAVSDSDLPRVGIQTNDVDYLHEQPWGAQVLWVDDDTIRQESGKYWAIIKMGRTQAISGIPGKAKASIASDASGNIIETLVDNTEKGFQFSARNRGSDASVDDKIVWGVDRRGDAFFILAEGGVSCDCVEKGGSDTFNQLSDYCDSNIHLSVPYDKELLFLVEEIQAAQWQVEFFSDVGLTTSVGLSDKFNTSDVGQAVNMLSGLTGTMQQVLDGTMPAAAVVSVVEAGDTSNVLSGYGGIKNLPVNLELGSPFQVHLIDDTGGFWHVEIYDTPGTILQAHTATFNSTGDKVIIDDGVSTSGPYAGTITVDALGPATTSITIAFSKTGDPGGDLQGWDVEDLWTKTRETTYVTKVTTSDWQVSVYNGGCRIAETAIGKATGALNLTQLASIGCTAITGTITVDRFFKQDVITIECPNACSCGNADCEASEATGAPGSSDTVIHVLWTTASASGEYCLPGTEINDITCLLNGLTQTTGTTNNGVSYTVVSQLFSAGACGFPPPNPSDITACIDASCQTLPIAEPAGPFFLLGPGAVPVTLTVFISAVGCPAAVQTFPF